MSDPSASFPNVEITGRITMPVCLTLVNQTRVLVIVNKHFATQAIVLYVSEIVPALLSSFTLMFVLCCSLTDGISLICLLSLLTRFFRSVSIFFSPQHCIVVHLDSWVV